VVVWPTGAEEGTVLETTIVQDGSTYSPQERLRRLVTSYFISQSIYVAAKLGIADLLADGPRSVEDLAAATAAHAPSLYRVLRLREGAGVCAKAGEREFMLNEAGECRQSDAPGSIRYAAMLFGEEPFRASAELLHTVRTGETAFEHVYQASH